MRALVCKACGASGLQIKNGYLTCDYCDSKFMLTAEDFNFYGNSQLSSKPNHGSSGASGISLGGDVEMLLQKCRMNPKNARKYANLILDIDPDNSEAKKYI